MLLSLASFYFSMSLIQKTLISTLMVQKICINFHYYRYTLQIFYTMFIYYSDKRIRNFNGQHCSSYYPIQYL